MQKIMNNYKIIDFKRLKIDSKDCIFTYSINPEGDGRDFSLFIPDQSKVYMLSMFWPFDDYYLLNEEIIVYTIEAMFNTIKFKGDILAPATPSPTQAKSNNVGHWVSANGRRGIIDAYGKQSIIDDSSLNGVHFYIDMPNRNFIMVQPNGKKDEGSIKGRVTFYTGTGSNWRETSVEPKNYQAAEFAIEIAGYKFYHSSNGSFTFLSIPSIYSNEPILAADLIYVDDKIKP